MSDACDPIRKRLKNATSSALEPLVHERDVQPQHQLQRRDGLVAGREHPAGRGADAAPLGRASGRRRTRGRACAGSRSSSSRSWRGRRTPPGRASAAGSRDPMARTAGWPNSSCVCCRSGLSTSWMRQPLGGTGSRSSSALGSGAGPAVEALERALERRRQRVGVDVAREREHQVLADEVAAEVRADLVGPRRFERRRDSVGGVSVGMIGVEVARRRTAPPARGRRCGARRSGRSPRGACAPARRRRSSAAPARRRPAPGRRPGCAPAPRPRSGSSRAASSRPASRPARRARRRSSSRDLPPAPWRAHSAARLVSPSRWRGSAAEPERDAIDHVHERDGVVALDDQQPTRPVRPGARPPPADAAGAGDLRRARRPPPASPTAARRSSSRASPFGRATTIERAPVAR